MSRAYYNEFDKDAAAWLRELIKAKLIMEGDVDERSICEVQPSDLKGYTRCHFFAGIGGWDYALQLAGWNPNQPVWTGSCPCQPFSAAGKQKGIEDERHLWPEFFRLIKECRPECVFGEQVAGAIGKGWLDGVSTDLEAEGYTCGAVVLGAHSVGAPHIRQRLYWVGHTGQQSGERYTRSVPSPEGGEHGEGVAINGGLPVGSPDASDELFGGLADNAENRWRQGSQNERGRVSRIQTEEMRIRFGNCGSACGAELPECARQRAPWSDSASILCRDNKYRRIPVEPALFPLAHGVPARVACLRGAGNAIVPQVAAAFIEAYIGQS